MNLEDVDLKDMDFKDKYLKVEDQEDADLQDRDLKVADMMENVAVKVPKVIFVIEEEDKHRLVIIPVD